MFSGTAGKMRSTFLPVSKAYSWIPLPWSQIRILPSRWEVRMPLIPPRQYGSIVSVPRTCAGGDSIASGLLLTR